MKFLKPQSFVWLFLCLILIPNVHLRSEVLPPTSQPSAARVIHVVVALCDNRYQGIVPVPANLGNGDDLENNLYWGAAYGVKSFFKKSPDWVLLSQTTTSASFLLERLLFKHKKENVFLIADAYRGQEIQKAVSVFLMFSAGQHPSSISTVLDGKSITISGGGHADLVVYVGHDGLMDFTLSDLPKKSTDKKKQAIILACLSKTFFNTPLRETGAHPLLWTNGLMAPEAYVLKAAIDGWLKNEDGEKIRKRASTAYHVYQKCGLKAAMNLFATGW